jgi:(1->4)-alpha-D-glucan 1-alpha-D-glucosylmutase
VRRWQALNDRFVTRLGNARAPARLHEAMLYQTLIGAWPLDGRDAAFTERMKAYAIKAAREGKVETSWTNPDEAYEHALTAFVGDILDAGKSGEFLDSFAQFAERTAMLGALNSLTQVALKATIPGVPDFYQGTEFWDLSLVDPDNRRPVDFAVREHELAALSGPIDWAELASHWRDGRIKLALTSRLLAWRQTRQAVFERGNYQPLAVTGSDRDHVIAFARTTRREAAIVVAGRLFASRSDGGRRWPSGADWNATLHLDGFAGLRGRLDPVLQLKGSAIPVAELFGALPLALLDAAVAPVQGTPKAPHR